MKSFHWFLIALFALVLPALGKPPVADEESYLFMAETIADHPLRPYDWWRIWQPWGEAPAEATYSFAHPPLHLWWLTLTRSIFPVGPAMRLVSAAPFLVLFAFSAHRLATRVTRHPNLALAFCLASPVMILGLHDSWMIDLGFLAFSTASVALYREALLVRDQIDRHKILLAGLFLGLAASYKYPSLVLVFLFVFHLKKTGLLRHSAPLWAGFFGLFGAMQAFLLFQYGEIHLFTALQSASEIDRSAFSERTAGTLVRFGFALSPLALLASKQLWRLLPFGIAVGGVCVVILGKGDLSTIPLLWLFFLASAGGAFLGRCLIAMWSSTTRKRRGDREDGLLLGTWVLLVLLSIALGHNHADSRYVLPALLPMSLLLVRSASQISGGKKGLQIGAYCWAAIAFLTALSDYKMAQETHTLVTQITEKHPPGRFSAEWTARRDLEQAGWTFWHSSEPLEPGVQVLLFANAGSSSPPEAGILVEQLSSSSHFPLRVLDWKTDAGYHSEQLGRLPLTWGRGPLVEALIYEVPQ